MNTIGALAILAVFLLILEIARRLYERWLKKWEAGQDQQQAAGFEALIAEAERISNEGRDRFKALSDAADKVVKDLNQNKPG